jgi:hypothetical protein
LLRHCSLLRGPIFVLFVLVPGTFSLPVSGRGRLGTTSGQLRSGNFIDGSCKRHQAKPLVFYPLCFASRGSPVRSRSRPPTFSLIAKDLRDSSLPHLSVLAPYRARTVHEWGYCTTTVRIGAAIKLSAVAGAISLARRLSFSRASRLICNFIWEYFLKTCASLWRSVTHSSAFRDLSAVAMFGSQFE